MKKRSIHQYDKDGRYIRSYESTVEAERAVGVKNVYSVAKKEKGSAGGFLWRYYKKEKIEDTLKKGSGNSKSIYVHNKRTGDVQEYESIKASIGNNKVSYYTVAVVMRNRGYYILGDTVFSFKRLTPSEVADRTPQNTQKREVEQRKDGVLIAVYPSVKEASRKTGITATAIYNCASPSSPHKTAGGFMWLYL